MIVLRAAPNYVSVFDNDLHIFISGTGTLEVSDELTHLFVEAREKYAWPKNRTAEDSQKRIVDLEQQVYGWTANLDGENAQRIVQKVSEWGGNNEMAKRAICCASHEQKQELTGFIGKLLSPGSVRSALNGLTGQPGVDLVMATKIYRFCVPQVGAVIDRHCLYFFNSLWDRRMPEDPTTCTQFRREWTNGKHRTTRLATFSKAGREWNLHQYLDSYLPLLGCNC